MSLEAMPLKWQLSALYNGMCEYFVIAVILVVKGPISYTAYQIIFISNIKLAFVLGNR